MVALSDLLVPVSEDQATDMVIGLLQALGFPATSWQKFSVPRLFTRLTAKLYSTASLSVSQIAAGGFLQTAKTLAPPGGVSGWLTLLAKSAYQNDRFLETTNAGVMRLQDAGGNGPTNIVPGQLVIGTPDGVLRWTVTSANPPALPLGGFSDVTVIAEQPGAAWNIASNYTGLRLVTTLPGVLVTNPIPIGASSWITESGTDIESDDDLIERCVTKWAVLSGAAPADAYVNMARTAVPAVTRVSVNSQNPDGPGTVRVYVATQAGPASVADVATVDAYIQAHRPLTATVTVGAADVLVVTITGLVYIAAAQVASATAAIAAALSALVQSAPIGGIIYRSQVSAAIGTVKGVRNIENLLMNGGGDITLTATQVATLSLGLVYKQV